MNRHGWTPLMFAISQENISGTQLLLESKADPNISRDKKLRTPLTLALCVDTSSFCALLLKHGVDVFVPFRYQQNIVAWSALDECTWQLNYDILSRVSQWDVGVCVLEQGDMILNTLQNHHTFRNDTSDKSSITKILNLVNKMSTKTSARVTNMLKRALRVEALACSVLRYI
jgi:hypothetical protein